MDTEKKKVGRPSKLEDINLEQVRKLAECGLTDDEIASGLGIAERTLENYKKIPEFMHALKGGKEISDTKVIRSLFGRATGYDKDGRHYPSDPTACIFWLKNRRRKEWNDQKDAIKMDFVNEFTAQIGAATNRVLCDTCPHCQKPLTVREDIIKAMEKLREEMKEQD